MILGVGIDLVEIPRMIRTLQSRWADRFIQRVFSQSEIAACERTATPAQGYAARFAAKEAFVKALGTGFSRGIQPHHISVQGTDRQRPQLVLSGPAHDVSQSMHVTGVHVSLTHTDATAGAVVVLEAGSKEDS